MRGAARRRRLGGAIGVLGAVCVLAAGAALATRIGSPESIPRGDMMLVPAGWFVMGSEVGDLDERPARRVYIDAYEIDRTEVTNAQFRAYLVDTGASAPRYWRGDDYPAGTGTEPVVGVGWRDACTFCEWAGKRLPTEAEWEKACAGTADAVYPWGDAWEPARANVRAATVSRIDDAWGLLLVERPGAPGPRPVGSYADGVSAYGVLDLSGNVAEWVADWYTPDGYGGWPVRNPVGAGPEWNHSIRGSAWFELGAPAEASRCSARNASHSYDDPRVGFRCARDASSASTTG